MPDSYFWESDEDNEGAFVRLVGPFTVTVDDKGSWHITLDTGGSAFVLASGQTMCSIVAQKIAYAAACALLDEHVLDEDVDEEE